MFILPLAHEDATVRKVPWVTLSIGALCIVVQLHSCVVEPEIMSAAEGLEQQAVRLEQTLEGDEEVSGPSLLPRETLEALGRDFDVRTMTVRPVEPPKSPEEALAEAERIAAAQASTQARIQEIRAERDEAIGRLPSFRLGYRPKVDGLWRMLTYTFAHGGLAHLLGNMLFLYLVGFNMEDRWGRKVFAAFYIGGGIIAALAFKLWHPDSTTPLVGASGAIAAAMGAFAVCSARTKIRFFYFFWIFLKPRWGTFQAPAWVALPLWFAEQAIMSFFETSEGTDVAYSAHVGGFVFGVAVAIALRRSGHDARLHEEGDRPERPEDEWVATPEMAAAQRLHEEGKVLEALTVVEALLDRNKNDAGARSLALELAIALKDQARVQAHVGAVFTQWLRSNQGERVASEYRTLRQRWSELELGEGALKAVLQAGSTKVVEPVVVIDAASQLIRQHPDSPFLPRAMWTAADAQARLNRPDLEERTLRNIVSAFPMDPIAAQASRRLERGLSLPPAPSN